MINTPIKLHLFLISLILLLAGSAMASVYNAEPPPPNAPQLGFHIDEGDVAHIEAAKAAGAEFAVIVFGWDSIEPQPNSLYWELPDAALRTAEFYGLEVVARLDRPPDWAFDDASPTPWNLDAYEAFVQRVAARYGDRLAGLIIWNEPNLSLEWNDQPPDPDAYVQLLRRAYQAAKSTAPELPVLMAGLAFTETDDKTAMNDLDFLQAVYEAGGGDYFDILAAHPYGFGRPPAEAPASDRLNFRRLELHRDLMEANGDADKPVWITEMGWRTAAPDSDDAWQVVSPQQQTDYTLAAIELAAEAYPWLERMAIWELNARGDDYGYDFWHGEDDVSLAYQTLVKNCTTYNPRCSTDPATRPSPHPPVRILEPDVIIRLGDRGTLHPHWVHLHRGGEKFSPDWQGDFFLTTEQAEHNFELLLETMQIDQPTNRVRINGSELDQLHTRTRPDPTSTWVTQRRFVPARLLQPGHNTIEIVSGQRNPAWQYSFWRWENFQFRNVRLVEPHDSRAEPLWSGWRRRSSPGGWGETNRLRPGLADDLWLTVNRAGGLWQETLSDDKEPATFNNRAGARADLIFTDVLPTPQGLLAATERGLFWQAQAQNKWERLSGTPARYGYVVAEKDGRFYAGFEESGLWTAVDPAGPWQKLALANLTVLDIGFGLEPGQVYVATNDGVHLRLGSTSAWQRLPELPGENSGSPMKQFMTRLYTGDRGEVVVRNLDQLWLYPPEAFQSGDQENWQPFGPAELHQTNKLYTVLDCCGAGAIVGTGYQGMWQLQAGGSWQRLDENVFDSTDSTELLRVGDQLFSAGIVAVLQSSSGGKTWRHVDGLAAVVTDLLIDPDDSKRWLAGTPVGIFRSHDSGQNWRATGDVRPIWDMAFGPTRRLFAASNEGVIWADDLSADSVLWQKTGGLGQATFFNVDPHPSNPDIVLAGTWGNDLAVSSDGGQSIDSIHNGLETLSVLDVLWHPKEGQLTIGTIEGVFRTDDGGESWFKLPGPLTEQTVYALWLTDEGDIFAGAADGLWRSDDYGVTWNRIEDVPVATVLRLGQVEIDGLTWLWVGTEEAGLWLSKDNGATWKFGGLEGLSVYKLLVDPNRSGYFIAATSAGIYEVEASVQSPEQTD